MVMCWRSGRRSLVDDALISLNEKPAAAPFIVRFEMAITPAEFRRLVYLLPESQQVRLDEMSATCEQTNGQRWQVTLSNARMRSLASLKLPIADVEIEMTGYSASEVQHFLGNSTLFSAGVEDSRSYKPTSCDPKFSQKCFRTSLGFNP